MAPTEEPLPLNVMVGLAHVNAEGADAAAFGSVVLVFTVKVATLEHPLASVMVTFPGPGLLYNAGLPVSPLDHANENPPAPPVADAVTVAAGVEQVIGLLTVAEAAICGDWVITTVAVAVPPPVTVTV